MDRFLIPKVFINYQTLKNSLSAIKDHLNNEIIFATSLFYGPGQLRIYMILVHLFQQAFPYNKCNYGVHKSKASVLILFKLRHFPSN